MAWKEIPGNPYWYWNDTPPAESLSNVAGVRTKGLSQIFSQVRRFDDPDDANRGEMSATYWNAKVGVLGVKDATYYSLLPTVGGAAWTPAELGASLSLWLDADDASTITLNGSTVSQWSDKSSNAILFSQPTASSQPSYGVSGLAKNTLNFDGADDFLDADDVLDTVWTGAAWQIFFVAKNNAVATNNGTIIAKVSNSPLNLRQFATYVRTNVSQLVTLYSPGVTDYTVINGSTFIADSQWVFSSQAYTDTGTGSSNTTNRVEIVVDGSEETEVVLASSGSLSTIKDTDAHLSVGAIIGDGTQLGGLIDGSIGEILVTSTITSLADRQKLEGYLAHKWGLAANLPVDHPYKDAAPTVTLS